MYERMKPLEALSPKTKFMYWIESFLISRTRAIRLDRLLDKVERGEDDAPQSYEEFIHEYTK